MRVRWNDPQGDKEMEPERKVGQKSIGGTHLCQSSQDLRCLSVHSASYISLLRFFLILWGMHAREFDLADRTSCVLRREEGDVDSDEPFSLYDFQSQ